MRVLTALALVLAVTCSGYAQEINRKYGKVKVTSSGSAGYLDTKVVAGTGISLSITGDVLTVSASGAAISSTTQLRTEVDAHTTSISSISDRVTTLETKVVDSDLVSISADYTADWISTVATSPCTIYSGSITIAESETGAFDDTLEIYVYNASGRRGSNASYSSTSAVRLYSVDAAVAGTAGNSFIIVDDASSVQSKDMIVLYSATSNEDEVTLVDYVDGNTIWLEEALLYDHAIDQNVARRVLVFGVPYDTATATTSSWWRVRFSSAVSTTLSVKVTSKP